MDDEFFGMSATLPENDPLFAPGLKRRDRGTWFQYMWLAPALDVSSGFAPKMVTFQHREAALEIAAKCRALNASLMRWRKSPDDGAPAKARQWRYRKAPKLPDLTSYAGKDGVYFLQCLGGERLVKIGYTTNRVARIEALMTACPYPLEEIGFHNGPRSLETFLHYHFRFDRLHGEWFRPSDEMLYIAHELPVVLARLVGRENARSRRSWSGGGMGMERI